MNSTAESAPVPRRDLLRPLRYLWRTPLLLLHALIAFPLALAVFNPLALRCSIGGERLDYRMTRWWSGRIVRIFGFRIRCIGEPLPGAVLFVANHVSWLDIELMHSQRIMSFVAKAEIARWPLVGWLATRAGTIYHQRGSAHSLGAVMERVVARLREGMAVGVFPEGGTGPGDRIKTFHARIFQVATDANVPVQPVALCYGDNGRMNLRVPFAPKESFVANFMRLLGDRAPEASVHFLEPVRLSDDGRRQTAEAARASIAAALGTVDHMTMAAEFRPRGLLRNPHVQSLLASSGVRRLLFRRRRSMLEDGASEHILDCGGGVRLQGFHTRQTVQARPRALAVLLHGWEGSVQSSYILHTGSRLLAEGCDVFRLNFRDHGATHHLNRELFHSCRIDEVVGAVREVSRRFNERPLLIGGYSLGGNFALRVALRAPAAGIPLSWVFAVCPVISPRAGLASIENAPWFYESYFMRKWRKSLQRKQSHFPQSELFSKAELRGGMRDLTRNMVLRHTNFGSLENYLDGYSIAGEKLAALAIPATILTAADDPVIPVAEFRELKLAGNTELAIAPHGGHCGFIRDLSLRSWAEDFVMERMERAIGT